MNVYKQVLVVVSVVLIMSGCTAHDAALLKHRAFAAGEIGRLGAITAVVALPASYLLKKTLWGTPVMHYSMLPGQKILIETVTREDELHISKRLVEQAAISAVAVSEKFGCNSVQFLMSSTNHAGIRVGLQDGKTTKIFYYKCSQKPDDGTRVQILEKHEEYIQRLWDKGKLVAKAGTNAPSPTPSSDDVQRTQRLLLALGYNVGKVDGVFGKRTEAAIREFQADNGLEVTGILDSRTKTRLFTK